MVVYPRYTSEKAVWKTGRNSSGRELPLRSLKKEYVAGRENRTCTCIILADELHQDVADQRLPVFGGQPLLQRVPEEQVSLQQLLHELQIRLTGSHTHTQKNSVMSRITHSFK